MSQRLRFAILGLGVLLATACGSSAPPASAPRTVAAATRPTEAVLQLTRALRGNRFDAFAAAAVPPALHARLDAAWRAGRTRWPLDELPFGSRLPALLQALAAPGAEPRLQQAFDRQFAGADGELHRAAAALGLFGAQYVRNEPAYAEDERAHYGQLVVAASRWGAAAPLGDRGRAHAAIRTLAAAARATGVDSEAAFGADGIDAGLRRFGPFAAAGKRVLAGYGLDLDASLGGLQASLLQQTGDRARVRMRYRLGDEAIDAVVSLQRIEGRWYLEDYLRHAAAAVAGAAPGLPAAP